jgi:aminoglycoside phosphotransferase (APT) family kinase protein
VEPRGPKLAEGRDGVIYEHGPGRVLRIVGDGRNLEHEARTMEYVHAQGVPSPAVHEAGDGWIVMDRIDGPTMLDWAVAPPFPIRRAARHLAALHATLHAVPAPPWLPEAPVPGDRVVHLDLHPLNVLMSADGPVLIDWSNASAGVPAYDIADTWSLFKTAEPDGLQGFEARALPVFRRLFLFWFLRATGARREAMAQLPAACERRFWDRNMKPTERERLVQLAEWARSRTRS